MKFKHLLFIVLSGAINSVIAQTTALPPQKGGLPNPGIDCLVFRERGPVAGSAIIAKPLPHDSRLVVFPYDKNALFPVNTGFNRFTHFEFEPGEKIIASYLNDETEWEQRVSATGADIFVRPRIRGTTGSMSVITDRRRYQIDLVEISSCPNEQRYQRVSWLASDAGVYEDREQIGKSRPLPSQSALSLPNAPGTDGPGASSRSGSPADEDMVALESLNTEYEIEGDSELAPVLVMDDGKRTRLKFRASTSLRPALFAVSQDGQAETVEYVPKGSYFLVNRVFPHGMLLKLGKREVRIRNKASSCGLFDSRCRQLKVTNIGGLQ